MATILVMHAQPFDASVTSVESAIGAPSGMAPDADSGDVTFYGDTTDVYACFGAGAYTTHAADTPASTVILDRIVEPPQYSIQLFGDADMSQPGQAAVGELVFEDEDGALDSWLAHGWDGRDVTLYRGDHLAAFSTFTVVARMTSDGWGEINQKQKRLRLRNIGWRLEGQLPIPRYSGEGGYGGPSSLEGATRPFTIGEAWSIPCTLIEPTLLIWQWHTGGFAAGNAVAVTIAVGGVTYSTTSYNTYDELAGATIAAGAAGVVSNLGLVRLGNALPQGEELRVRGRGFKSGTTAYRAEELLEHLIDVFGPLLAGSGYVPTSDVNVSASAGFSGWHLRQGETPPTLAGLLSTFCYPIGWYWWPSLTGAISVRDLVAPEDQSADHDVDMSKAGTFLGEPVVTALIPRQRVTMRVRRRWAPEPRASLAGEVDDEDADDLGREWLDLVASDEVATGVAHPSARVSVFDTVISSKSAGSSSQASVLLNVLKEQRYVITALFRWDEWDPPLGEIINLQNWNRFGFGATKHALCIGAETVAEQRGVLKLTLFA